MSRYSKVDRRTWGDAKFRALSKAQPNAQTLWLYLLTGPHNGPIPGLFSIGAAGLAEALGWEVKPLRERFGELFQAGLARVDWEARLVWLPNAIRHNAPANPNIVKGWSATWDELPECELKAEAFRGLETVLETLGKPFAEAFRNGCPNGFGNRLPNQEQEQEQEQETKSPPPPKGGDGSLSIPGIDAEPKRKRKRVSESASKPEPEPMPWTIADMLSALSAASRGQIVVDPFAPELAWKFTRIIRDLAASRVTLEDMTTVGEWVASGGLSFMAGGVGLTWLAKPGHLAEAVGKARAWKAAGRRPVQGARNFVPSVPIDPELRRNAIDKREEELGWDDPSGDPMRRAAGAA